MARVGALKEEEWKRVQRVPCSANLLITGVAISPPNGARSEKPISSTTTKRIFGRSLSATCVLAFSAMTHGAKDAPTKAKYKSFAFIFLVFLITLQSSGDSTSFPLHFSRLKLD